MPEYLSPGVYMEEFEIGARPIEGVSTSTAGFLGETERGPTTPRLITSWLQFQRVYGSYFGNDKYLPGSVEGFFNNGGSRCYIARIVKIEEQATELFFKSIDNIFIEDEKKDPAKEHEKVKDFVGKILKVKAVGEGDWGKRIAVIVSTGTFSGIKLDVFYWKAERPNIQKEDTLAEVLKKYPPAVSETFDNISINETSSDYFEKTLNGISNLIIINIDNSGNKSTPQDLSLKMDLPYFYLDISDNLGQENQKTATTPEVDPGNNKVAQDASSPNASGTEPSGATVPATTPEVDQENKKVVQDASSPNAGGTESNGATVLTASDYVRDALEDDKPGKRKGLTAFKEIEDISIIYAPDASSVVGLVSELISHCEILRYRFAILDAPLSSSDLSNLDPRSGKPTKDFSPTDHAAFYYPWIKVTNPETGLLQLMPPGGYIAGIYARSDIERGVHKAPANEIVKGALDLEFQIMKGEQDVLNPRGVNVIRAFSGRGILVWGARTLSSNTLWKYINVRRLFIYIEASLEKGTQWVVFEPNDDHLWGRVKATITQFLTSVWRSGALMGTTPEEAFFVKCDRSTMTQDDIDNGRLICIIGIAPVKPAEFVIFRIAQWQGGSASTE